MNEIVETRYIDKKTKTEKIQYWIATIEEEFFGIRQLLPSSAQFEIVPICHYFEKLNGNWQHQRITFVPLSENNPLAYESRLYHRGYENDPEPFIFRGRELNELKAIPYNNLHSQGITFRPYLSNHAELSPKTQEWLESTFGKQLRAYHTKEYVNFLQDQAKERCRRRITQVVETLKIEADKFLNKLAKLS